jgi:hypothetical protein
MSRRKQQMPLGALRDALSALPGTWRVEGFGQPHSYRGYYDQIAFAPDGGSESAKDLAARVADSVGATFTGWKGGEFTMDENTPVWIAHEGSSGDALIGLLLVDGDGEGEVLVLPQTHEVLL